MRKVDHNWGYLGFHVIMYLDDDLSGHNTFNEASAITNQLDVIYINWVLS